MSFYKNEINEIQDLLDFDFESYLLEFNKKITLLTSENDRLKQIIVQKNELIHQLEECIISSSVIEYSKNDDSIKEKLIKDDLINEELIKYDTIKNADEEHHNINYAQLEKYLIKNGLYRHPKMVMKYMHHQ